MFLKRFPLSVTKALNICGCETSSLYTRTRCVLLTPSEVIKWLPLTTLLFFVCNPGETLILMLALHFWRGKGDPSLKQIKHTFLKVESFNG